jgi:hypothetical protein
MDINDHRNAFKSDFQRLFTPPIEILNHVDGFIQRFSWFSIVQKSLSIMFMDLSLIFHDFQLFKSHSQSCSWIYLWFFTIFNCSNVTLNHVHGFNNKTKIRMFSSLHVRIIFLWEMSRKCIFMIIIPSNSSEFLNVILYTANEGLSFLLSILYSLAPSIDYVLRCLLRSVT